jgi:(R,R)-butanediol dehydrogenase/meso-butanediol dehydrogenase/diacetyl reductase
VLLAEKQPRRRALLANAARVRLAELTRESIDHLTEGRPIRFAVEATGVGPVLDSLLDLVQGGARIAMVGIFHGAATINATAIVEREIELKGCSVFADEQKEAVALLPALAPRLASLVSAPIALADVPGAYLDLIEGRAPALKTIVRPNGP